MGTPPACRVVTRFKSLSTQMTECPSSARHAAATNPTYPEPTTVIFSVTRSPFWASGYTSSPHATGPQRTAPIQCTLTAKVLRVVTYEKKELRLAWLAAKKGEPNSTRALLQRFA